LDAIEDNSLDVIRLTNVLDHLKNPIAFLNRAANKLKSGGKVIATEPFFSPINCHVQVSASRRAPFPGFRTGLELCAGAAAISQYRVALANFFWKLGWLQRLNNNLDLASLLILPFSAVSYMVTGGISHRLRLHVLFTACYFRWISRRIPRFCAAFFTLTLTRR
jgi:methyltransferase family protein